MKLSANVSSKLGTSRHYVVGPGGGATQMGMPVRLEIVGRGGAFYLFRFDAQGETVGDTWHESIEEAKDQALEEFGIAEEDWALREP